MEQSIERKENWHEDFIVYLASQYRPKVYVELGLYQCELLNKVVPYADTLIGVDISAEAGKLMTVSDKTTFVNSTTDQFAEALKQNPISIDMLFIDADHSKESVLKDFWNFFPFVNDHGLILLHDTHPKNYQYADKGYCGDAYLVIEELKNHSDEFEMMTIPIHPGLTLIRKRKTQLSWESSGDVITINASDYYDRNVNKSIAMPAFVSKVKQMFNSENDIKTIVEIGALDAQDSQYFKKVFPTAMVYAIEALPDNYDKYLKNLKDIVCINAVVSNVDSEITFYKKEINGIHSIYNRGNEYGSEVINLPSYRFETLAEMNGINSVDMLKLDVEGATIEVLEGMGDLLSGVKIMHLESESYPFFEGQKLHNEVVKYLEEKGFSLIELTSFPIQPGRLQYDSVWINNIYLNNKEVSEIIKVNEEENSTPHYKIVVIAQIYNEMRKGNLERFWEYIQSVCDGLVVYDDGSTDGSYEYMLDKAIFTIRAGENDFENELSHKKVLLEYALKLQPDFILRMDADELLTSNLPAGKAGAQIELQNICKYADENNIDAISFHEINLWRSHSWKRIDNSYDLGWFVRLWRVTPGLMYNETNRGLHQQDYPQSITTIKKTDSLGVIHYGFDSDLSLAFKYFVYRSHGQTGWALERLLDESTLSLEKVDEELFPPGLYIDDNKPTQRSFSEALASLEDYKQVVFKPRISIVCLIYKSTDWLKFVYEQVLKYTDLRDKEFYFVANDANEEVLSYLDQNYIPHFVWNNSPEQRKEWYINNVYRAWNYAADMAKGDYLLFINSDMAFSENWVENLFSKLNGNNCVASRLVESGKLLSGDHAISKNFGRSVNDYDETAFQEYVETISKDELISGGLFMPLLIRKDHFMKISGYPEGNIVPGTDIFHPELSKQGQACVSGDVVLMQKLKSIGVTHTTSFDSVVYHFQCGEMDATESNDHKHDEVRTIISNDYLLGRMGEKTMWGFLLSNLPNAVGVDMDVLHLTENFEQEARKHIKENYPDTAVIVQNASFIDLIDKDHYTILYLQDNLRAMGRKSFQQEVNLKHANLLVTNSKVTAASYPEYDFEIIPIGVDDNLFRPLNKKVVRSEFNIPDGKVGIFVGDLSEVKGWEKVKNVIDNHDEIFWIVVSKDSKQYEKNNCKTFNRIDQETLAKLLNCADFFILGSPVETQCLAAIEACFCNLPLIMRNTGIFADFTKDEREELGYFGEDFEQGLSEVLVKKYFPREMMFKKKLTIDGMVKKWKTVISRARFFAEQKVLKPVIERPPFFSVIVPTYNQAQYLGAALDSLLTQTYTNWEAVIVNDGSTDNTKDVIDKYLSLDKRFKTYHKENGGVATALNIGIQHAKGQWICWLSSDDWYENDKLENHYNAITEYPDIKFFISHWFLFLQQTGQKIKQELWLEIPVKEFQVTRFFLANYVHGNSISIHKSIFQNVGVFDEALRQGQDFDMWLRIAAQYQVHFIDKRTCVTRIHAGQTTNTFVEGGVLDSTRALFKFLNNHTFEDLFPFLDLSIPQDILKAVNEIIYITTKDNAFIYKCGFTTALMDKTLFWINKQSEPLRSAIRKKITEIVSFYLSNPIHPEVKTLMSRFLAKKISVIEKHDFVEDGMKYIDELLGSGEQKKAKAIETYFNKISLQFAADLAGYRKFRPKILGYPEVEVYAQLNPSKIESWIIQPGITHSNSIQHKISFTCSECGSHAKINFEYVMTAINSEINFICPECKTGLKYNDKELNKDLLEYNQYKIKNKSLSPNNRIAFFIADASIIGGGSKVLFKYINWLNTLGADVTLYSFSTKPDWTEVAGRYVQLSENSKIDGSACSRIFVFSIYDVPMMINYVPLEKIVHICQGYEGYHYGTTYEELRSDKHVLTELHAIPVKNIVISKHLVELFKTKLGRETEYVPNGVDHNIFYPNFNQTNREKAITFMGNPKHLLKGFHFLAHGIKVIQNSQMRIEDLKLYVVLGFELQDSEETQKKLELELNCKVEFLMKQSSEEVAELLRRVRAVVCTSWYEGFSLPLLEGMACGTPVISTRNMGAESFCEDGYNSFLINYGDVNELTSKLIDLLYLKLDFNSILENGLTTSIEYSEYNSANSFINSAEKLLRLSFADDAKQKLLSCYNNFCRSDLDRYLMTDSDENSAMTINDHISESNFYINGNNLEYALKHIEQALVLSLDEKTNDSGYSDLLNFAGNLHYALRNYDKAQEYFEQQLIFSPESSSACLGLGEVFSAREEYDNAKVMYEWAVKNDPKNQIANNLLVKVNTELGLEQFHNSLSEEV